MPEDNEGLIERVASSDLVNRLCELHRRLLLCFQGATGQAPPRRPRLFTPQYSDTTTVLDAAMALERTEAASLQGELQEPTSKGEQ
jgi:hypothetical protein